VSITVKGATHQWSFSTTDEKSTTNSALGFQDPDWQFSLP